MKQIQLHQLVERMPIYTKEGVGYYVGGMIGEEDIQVLVDFGTDNPSIFSIKDIRPIVKEFYDLTLSDVKNLARIVFQRLTIKDIIEKPLSTEEKEDAERIFARIWVKTEEIDEGFLMHLYKDFTVSITEADPASANYSNLEGAFAGSILISEYFATRYFDIHAWVKSGIALSKESCSDLFPPMPESEELTIEELLQGKSFRPGATEEVKEDTAKQLQLDE